MTEKIGWAFVFIGIVAFGLYFITSGMTAAAITDCAVMAFYLWVVFGRGEAA